MEVNKYFAQLRSKYQLTTDIYEFRFEKPKDFTFQAGQFVQFCVPEEEKIWLRAYSISSPPHATYLEFCVKLYPDGKAGNLLKNMPIGGILEFQGPRGLFIHKENGTALSFVATGTGIAPIMGMIRDELENKKNEQEIRLLFGVRTEDDIFWLERFQNLKIQYPNFQYEITLSQPKVNGGWSGLRGRVTDHILHRLVQHQFYLCGSAAMVKDIREILLKNGVEAKKIHFEIF